MASAITEFPGYEGRLTRDMNALSVIVTPTSSSCHKRIVSPTLVTKEKTETPRKLKQNNAIHDNQPDEMELDDHQNSNNSNQEMEETPSFMRPYPPKTTIGHFSPRPKRRQIQLNPTRRAIDSAFAIQALRQVPGQSNSSLVTTSSFRVGNQSSIGGLDRIQESEESEDDSHEDDEFGSVYDGHDEISEVSIFSKSYSGDLLVRYDSLDSVRKPHTRCPQNHQGYQEEDEDVVCM